MPTMTDPMDALLLYQQAFERGMIPVQPGRQDRDLLVAVDHPNGKVRFSYMRAEGSTLTALVMFAQDGMDEGRPVFALGYAVPEAYRGCGLGKQTVMAALAELKAGLGGARISVILVEAVIDPGNIASQRIAAAVLTTEPSEITDSVSGKPALYYTQAIDCSD